MPRVHAPPHVPAERKLVTVLFADLTGYTALASTLDPEEVYGFIRPAMTGLVELVERFGGTVPQIMGDGFLAIFGVPATHEDDGERAARAALAAVEHIHELNRGRSGIRLPEVHAGLNTGEVMVAPTALEPSGFHVVGDTVNVGSRVAGLAKGGQVLVTERTRELTAHAIRYGPRRLERLKGKGEPLSLYEALGVLASAPAGHVSVTRGTPFVGRATALGKLESALSEATTAGGRFRLVVMTGDPGIGKTRLASEFAGGLRGVRAVFGRCPPYGQWLPQLALAQAVGEVGGLSLEGGRGATEHATRRLLRTLGGPKPSAQLDRQLRVLMGVEGPPPSSTSAAPGVDVRLAARRVLEAVAALGPALVILDDLQWADPDLVELIREAHETPWSGPLLILGLARRELEADLKGVPLLRLEAMSPADLRTIVEASLGPDVPTSLADELVLRAGGNPLYLEESMRMLVESGGLARVDGAWRLGRPGQLDSVPPTLRLLVAARLDGLSPEEKRVLQDASVAGQVTWDRLAEHLWGGPEAGRHLRRLEARDLLRRRPRSRIPDAVEYEFKHIIIRDVAYDSLPRAHRAARHVQIAEWLRGRAGGDGEDQVDALANHYEQAWLLSASRTGAGPAPAPETARLAAAYLERWADRAYAYQPRLSESIYARGLSIARSVPEAIGPELLTGLLIGRAESLIELARSEEALADAREARDLASLFGDRNLRARALLTLGHVESDVANLVAARALLEESLGLMEATGDLRSQAWALHHLSDTWRLDDLPREVDLLGQAHDIFAGLGDRAGQLLMAQEMAYLLTTNGGAEFRERYEEARRLAEEEGDVRSRAALLRTLSYHAYYCWDFEKAARAARQARPAAREVGDVWLELDALVIEAQAASAVGPPGEALRLAEELLGKARTVKSLRLEALAHLVSVRPALRLGQPAVGERHLRAARRILGARPESAEMGDADVVEAMLRLERGQWKRAEQPAMRLEAWGRRGGWKLYQPVGPLVVGRARLGMGKPEEAVAPLTAAVAAARDADAAGALALARACLDQARILSGRARRAGSPRPSSPEVEAIVQENRALLASRSGDAAAATEGFAHAVAKWEELGLTSWLARTLAFQAEALRAAKRPAGARKAEARSASVMAALTSTRDRTDRA